MTPALVSPGCATPLIWQMSKKARWATSMYVRRTSWELWVLLGQATALGFAGFLRHRLDRRWQPPPRWSSPASGDRVREGARNAGRELATTEGSDVRESSHRRVGDEIGSREKIEASGDSERFYRQWRWGEWRELGFRVYTSLCGLGHNGFAWAWG